MFKFNQVRYRDIISVDDLTISSNETTCIVGESGSGKTTFLKLLNHMVNYNQGTITYRGEDLKNLDPINLRREVILLPQAPVIFPGTVRDNLLIGLAFSGRKPVDDKRLLEEMKYAGLDKRLDEEAEPLSGGEKQRLALIRVILMEPNVLLLDEPTSALDEGTELSIIEYINNYLKTKDKTLIMVTHSRELAKSMGDRMVNVNKGIVTAVEEVA